MGIEQRQRAPSICMPNGLPVANSMTAVEGVFAEHHGEAVGIAVRAGADVGQVPHGASGCDGVGDIEAGAAGARVDFVGTAGAAGTGLAIQPALDRVV